MSNTNESDRIIQLRQEARACRFAEAASGFGSLFSFVSGMNLILNESNSDYTISGSAALLVFSGITAVISRQYHSGANVAEMTAAHLLSRTEPISEPHQQ